MRFEVWHAKDPNFGMGPSRKYPDDYEKVAIVECSAGGMTGLEEAFALTNHVDRPWTENRGVVELPAGKAVRSTSVGDVVVDGEGKAHRCAGTGWEDVR